MQATRARSKAGGTASKINERQLIESIFRKEGLPGWLGWGTYGAESSYGADNPGNTHYFGLIEPSYAGVGSPNGELVHDAQISAGEYKKLVEQYGSVAAAVPHYSGNNYTVSHVREKARGGGQGKTVPVSLIEHLGELLTNPGGALGFGLGESLGEGKGVPNPLEPLESAAGALGSLGTFFSFLTSGETWIRLAEILAGAILLFLALKGLTGAELAAALPV